MFNRASWVRARNFYRRNYMIAWCGGLLVFLHAFWWQIQQNRHIVPVHQRVRAIGPFKIPYLDELESSKTEKDNSTQAPSK